MRDRDTPARPARHGDKEGLTKREECAMRIMAGLATASDGWEPNNALAQRAVLMADALFDALEKSDE